MNSLQDNFDWEIIDSSSFSEARTEKAFSKIMRRAGRQRRTTAARWIAAAAVIIIPALSLYISRIHIDKPAEIQQLTASAGNGHTTTVYLPDSTKVVLNSGSVLFYPSAFSDKERIVCLSGEALFDVRADKERPFFVTTSDMKVKVFGTMFDVQAYPDDNTVSTTLCRGSVGIIRNCAPGDITMISPGEEFKLQKNNGTFSIATVNQEDSYAWEHGGICISAGSIHDLIRILERQFNINVYLTSNRFDSEIITAKFIHGESPEDIMKVVSSLLPDMRYSITDSNIYIH